MVPFWIKSPHRRCADASFDIAICEMASNAIPKSNLTICVICILSLNELLLSRLS
jgi:hypothetical protein